ncbi:MAG: hypothetical protein V1731_00070 [Candidatus Aenigmatarchaeota archaeon]
MADPFSVLIGNLARLGFYNFVFPWLFTMALIFGILLKVKLFEGQQALNGLLSIVIAFFLVNYTPIGFGLSEFFTRVLGMGVLILVVIFVIMLFMGLVGLKGEDIFKAENLGGGAAIALLLGLFGFLLFSFGGFNIPSDIITIVVVMIMIIFVVLFIARGK